MKETLKTIIFALFIVLAASVSIKAAKHSVANCKAQAMNEQQVRECLNF